MDQAYLEMMLERVLLNQMSIMVGVQYLVAQSGIGNVDIVDAIANSVQATQEFFAEDEDDQS